MQQRSSLLYNCLVTNWSLNPIRYQKAISGHSFGQRKKRSTGETRKPIERSMETTDVFNHRQQWVGCLLSQEYAVSEEHRTQQCSTCGDVKPYDAENFPRDRNMVTGLARRCRVCARRAALKWKKSPAGKTAGRKYSNSERGREMYRLRRARIKQNKETNNEK
jgi:hypothetical protein